MQPSEIHGSTVVVITRRRSRAHTHLSFLKCDQHLHRKGKQGLDGGRGLLHSLTVELTDVSSSAAGSGEVGGGERGGEGERTDLAGCPYR